MALGSLTLYRGDDQDVGLVLANPDGTPYNLSGCAVTLTVRQDNTYFSNTLLQKQVTQHLDEAAGLSQISFASADTEGLNANPRYFDIKLLSAASKVTTLMHGTFTVLPR